MNRTQIESFGSIVGAHPSMKGLFETIPKVAQVDTSVLIVGETGTGKDLIAHEIHKRSDRTGKPFVAVNTGILTEELVASELFGHCKGAFTGATEHKDGRFAEADGGTLFLDEIATMDEATQVALLRVLDTGAFRPLGAKRDSQSDARLIAATNADLQAEAEAGHFRYDLLHRLEVFILEVPPLRERGDDLWMLCQHFLEFFRHEFGYKGNGVSDMATELLRDYSWPGNVRELRNAIAQAVVSAQNNCIEPEHLPRRISAGSLTSHVPQPAARDLNGDPRVNHNDTEGLFIPFGQTLDEVQRHYILRTLERCGNNKTQAARELGLSRKTLYSRLDRWGYR